MIEVFTLVNVNITAFSYVRPWSFVDGHQHIKKCRKQVPSNDDTHLKNPIRFHIQEDHGAN
jgi:hypothetical protein